MNLLSLATGTALVLFGLGNRNGQPPVPSRDAVRSGVRVAPRLADHDRFGTAVTPIGDLDQDGVADLAVGAFADDGGGSLRGAVWILFLRADGTIERERRITPELEIFGDRIGDAALFGSSLALVGDLDRDGRPELAVGAPGPRTGGEAGDAGPVGGSVWLLSLERDGSVHAARAIAPRSRDVGADDYFGFALAAPGDLDGDGTPDLVVGSPYARNSSADRGALWVLHLGKNGAVARGRRLDDVWNARQPASIGFDAFGYQLVAVGDLDGDGRSELAVGAPWGDDLRGGLWTLYLDGEDRVRRRVRIGAQDGGFGGSLEPGDLFGTGLAPVGDFDGDGVPDLAVGAPGAGEGMGALWILLLRADGTVRAQVRVDESTDALSEMLGTGGGFGRALALLGDLDGDARPELVAGSWNDSLVGKNRGAIWTLFLDGCFGPSVTQRTGWGTNPSTLSTTSAPRAGETWEVRLDCSGHSSGLAIVTGRSQPASGALTRAGEVLVDLSPGTELFTFVAPQLGEKRVFRSRIPDDVSACNLAVYVQGACTDGAGVRLSNALDLVLGR